jgi:5-methylphenazine-1-carboxylate 1-monooxygenase
VIDAVEQLAPQGFTDIESVLNYESREAIVRGYAARAGFAARVVSRQDERQAS